MAALIEKMKKLDKSDGYVSVNNPYFKGFTEFNIIAVAKDCGYTVRWSAYEKSFIIIP